MASDNKIQIEIEVNGERALATLNLTEDNIKNLGASFNQAKRNTSDFSSSAVMGLQDVRNAVQGLEGIWRTFNATFNQSFALYERQINAEQRLEAVLRASGREVEQNSARLREMASALQEVTTFGDEDILEAQAILLTFQNIGLDTLPQVTEAALDMASVFGGTATSNAQRLARALEDPERGLQALRRIGVMFTAEQEEQIRTLQASGRQMEAQALILDELEGKFAGTARAIADTPAGRFRQLQNELGDVREEMGSLMATGILPFVEGISTILNRTNQLSPAIGGVVGTVGTLTGAYIALNVTGLTPVLRKMATAGPTLKSLSAQKVTATAAVTGLAGGFRTATVAVRGFFAALGPIGWITVGLSVLIPLIGRWSSSNKDAAESTDELVKSLENLTIDERRQKLDELTGSIEALRSAIRNAESDSWRDGQMRRLEELETKRSAVAAALLKDDREAIELEIGGQSAVLSRIETDLKAARQALLSARGRQAREEAVQDVRALRAREDQIRERITSLQDQLRLLEEQRNQDSGLDPQMTADQQQLLEQLRLETIRDSRQRELAELEQWYTRQQDTAGEHEEIVTLLRQFYTDRRSEINEKYAREEAERKRHFEEQILQIETEFRRLSGESEEMLLQEKIERLETELQAEEEGSRRYQQIYINLKEARLNLAREQKQASDAALEQEQSSAERRKRLLAEIAEQELDIFEARKRLELAESTREMPAEERRLAELALEQTLLLNRKEMLQEELSAVQENADLTVEERTKQANAVSLELLRIEQALLDNEEAARSLEQTFEWTFGNIVGYANQVLGAMQNMFSDLARMYQQDARRRIESETQKRNEAIDSAEQQALLHATTSEERTAIEQAYEQKREELEEQALQKKAEAARKIFALQQAASIGQATMSTYEAATRALTIPPPFGQILAGILTAAGLANVAVIAQQEPPAFATGGLFRGEGGPTDDANLVRLSDGEYVVNAASTTRYLPLLEAINTNRIAPPQPLQQSPQNLSSDMIKELRALRSDYKRSIPSVPPVARIDEFHTAAILERGEVRRNRTTSQYY